MMTQINLFDYNLKYHKNNFPNVEPKINYTINNNEFKDNVDELMKTNNNTSENMPFTTIGQASIKAKSKDLIWIKQYPYPMCDHNFVRKEIEKLNNPNKPKKSTKNHGRPKRRMVVDFQKINALTIIDRYPISYINMTVQNLRKAECFQQLI